MRPAYARGRKRCVSTPCLYVVVFAVDVIGIHGFEHEGRGRCPFWTLSLGSVMTSQILVVLPRAGEGIRTPKLFRAPAPKAGVFARFHHARVGPNPTCRYSGGCRRPSRHRSL